MLNDKEEDYHELKERHFQQQKFASQAFIHKIEGTDLKRLPPSTHAVRNKMKGGKRQKTQFTTTNPGLKITSSSLFFPAQSHSSNRARNLVDTEARKKDTIETEQRRYDFVNGRIAFENAAPLTLSTANTDSKDVLNEIIRRRKEKLILKNSNSFGQSYRRAKYKFSSNRAALGNAPNPKNKSADVFVTPRQQGASPQLIARNSRRATANQTNNSAYALALD